MKRETILSILLNVAFVLCVFGIRYFYVKKEYNFLKDDSQRQEILIENLQSLNFLLHFQNQLDLLCEALPMIQLLVYLLFELGS